MFVMSFLMLPPGQCLGWLHTQASIRYGTTMITGIISLCRPKPDNASVFASGLPDQLDLGWLHRLAGRVASPAFTPPNCDFEVVKGPHTEAVMRVTAGQCNALELASSRLVACGIHTVALDLATQVSLG